MSGPVGPFQTIDNIQNPGETADVEAIITVGAIDNSIQDNSAAYNDDGTWWTDYVINNKYEGDRHIYMMPLTASVPSPTQPSVAFVQLASPTLLWISDITACRAGAVPIIPNPLATADPFWVLLDQHVETAIISVAADGITPIYRLSATFVYGSITPGNSTMCFGRPPWLDDKFPRVLDNTVLGTSIMDQTPIGNAFVLG